MVLDMVRGTMKGPTFLAPLSRSVSWASTRFLVDGPPEPTTMPERNVLLDAQGTLTRRRFVSDIFHQHREFVGAQAGHGIAGLHLVLQAARHRQQQLVADRVAQAFIDHAKAVQIERGQSETHRRMSLVFV